MNHEQLSALLDGELDELATARLLKTLEAEAAEDWSADWETYSLIGDALREGDRMVTTGSAGAQRALAQIAQEPAPERGSRLSVSAGLAAMPALTGRWIPWAIAASAALVVFQLNQIPLVGDAVTASAGSMRQAAHAMLASTGLGEAEVQLADPAEMDRFIDLHREIATTGFQRTSLEAVSSSGGARGQ